MAECVYIEGLPPRPGWRFRATDSGAVHQWLCIATGDCATVEAGEDSFARAMKLLEDRPADRMVRVRAGVVEIGRMFFSEALWANYRATHDDIHIA